MTIYISYNQFYRGGIFLNSKILVTIIMIVSATLGLYIGINQVSSQKEGTKDVFNPNIETSGDFSSETSHLSLAIPVTYSQVVKI